MTDEKIRTQIISLTKKYYLSHFANKKKFNSRDKIPYAARVFDEKEMINLINASLDFWLTAGKYASEFEKKFADFIGVKYCALVNSGSSANLLAFMALTSPLLKDRQIKRGDEIITVAAGFPTTVAPIIQYGAKPVFIDIELPSYNIKYKDLEKAISKKTKAVMLAHTLGIPFNIPKVKAFCNKYNLWLIEDNCDALGSKFNEKYTGTFGDIATSSFYPPHHLTMGEGGAVYTNDKLLNKIVLSLRDWGRDCWCPSGKDNTCGCRFDRQFGELPLGYDHKYVYSHFGYNLKATDLQAAIGCAQIDKLPDFIRKRQENWQTLYSALKEFQDIFIFSEPYPNSEPSWFGFLITIKQTAKFKRAAIVNHLEQAGIQTRMLFAGNLIKHPCFDEFRNNNKVYKIIGNLENTNYVMNNTFWLGVYPGLTTEMIDYIIKQIKLFLKKYK